jgi:uncharacterized damage-inducible protein DinB
VIITKIDGYTEQISYLICMMNYTRNVTLNSIHGLSQKELDTLLDGNSNTIGSLLLHIASIEYAYYINTVEEREMTDQEKSEWGVAIRLGQEAREQIRGNELDYYLDKLNKVRNRTLEAFKDKDDKWLLTVDEYYQENAINRYFKWFHVFEDELNHRGQINLIKKRIAGLS